MSYQKVKPRDVVRCTQCACLLAETDTATHDAWHEALDSWPVKALLEKLRGD